MAKSPKLHETDKDRDSALLVTGRHQKIAADPAKEHKRSMLAAGAVLWRGDVRDLDSIEIAVIHRPHYDDWSLAKGKVDPGETLPTTAAREILEETGYEVQLGKLLGKVTYPVLDRTKVVYYWTGEVLSGEFVPNDEVDEIRWLPIDEAKELLSYDVDTQVLAKAEKRFRLPATSRILYVRHGRAHQRRNWDGEDNLRPLDKKGRRQAEMLVPMLLPYRPTAVYSALPDRCQATAAPLADELNLDVEVDRLFGDDGWLESMTDAQARFREVIDAGGVSVVVGQGTVIPDMIAWLSAQGRLPLDEIEAKKASVWVLSFHDGELTGADYLVSPLPVK
ncbi:bifunctional NUDIX hydrolase/histidine phosphatase family protein [Corynebacterium halotolerans]|uniref:NTP pyrophosphohydrolase n=1 Tax=Corynebacterium halotolerans YIM 70093 = DSM 44683 TaxID=1121362 RepID=M1NS63_9CORY|nr:bifunctional NUDIX hydrolase/histidine phosphatase family protein [Corynebacterium halotolerans]AGF72327.1 NTP pyrophosphohydrolase [Corynebacterium halotolerans YIM 70093 = DSM 44683]